MRKLFFSAAVIVFFAGCRTIDDSKYEKMYFENLNKLEEFSSDMKKDHSGDAQFKRLTGTAGPRPGADILDESEIKEILNYSDADEARERKRYSLKTGRDNADKSREPSGSLKIRSENLKYNRDTGIADFMGDVTVYSEDITVKADRLRSRDYKENAVATGNVTAFYDEHRVVIYCGIMEYTDGMDMVSAGGDVVAVKTAEDGNTLTMKADQIIFDVKKGDIRALKRENNVAVYFEDIVVFSEEVLYNEKTGMLSVFGRPVFRKKENLFFSEYARVDVKKKRMMLSGDIWSKLFYSGFKDIKKEYSDAETESTGKQP
ncbi:MAG: LptA/OstA family protein [Candidatus Goldiibacteriota bacterium]